MRLPASRDISFPFAMIEAVADLAQEEMEVFARYAAIRIEPVLGVAPETLDAIVMISGLGPALLLAHDDMVALDAQAAIGLPIIDVVETSRGDMCAHQVDDLFGLARRDREGSNLTVALHDPKDHRLAGRAPTAFTFADASKERLVTFNRTGQTSPPVDV